MVADRRVALVLVTAALALALAPARASAWCRMTTNTMRTVPETECDPEGIPLAWGRHCISYALNEDGARDFSLEDADRIA